MPTASSPPPGFSFAPLQPGTPFFADAVRLFLVTWPSEGGTVGITDFFTRYAALPDYHGIVALRAGALVGFGFGARSLPGQWWHDRVAEQVGVAHPALQDAWVLVDLAVAPEVRSRGIGSALMEALLAAQHSPRALLSTEVGNAGARRLYERHGWSYLHPGFAFNPGEQPYVVMRRELAASVS
jgi:ribosomal protein S18 acetylase RimI-like enzyme